jgi:hypothetical protein
MAVLALVLLLAAGAWHLTALSAYRATEHGGTTASRLASARLASALEPWNVRFAWRVVTLRGMQLLEAGQVDAAFWLLLPYTQIVRDDPVYTSVYRQAVALKTPLDARKAHQQHAREQTGGVLLEKDVIP